MLVVPIIPLAFTMLMAYCQPLQRTPLSRAAEKGEIEVVKLLLENGARPDFEDSSGQTPLSRASDGGHATVVELLNSY